jgi:protein-S-isoprenylcysteine O-methyltransferase Ste14
MFPLMRGLIYATLFISFVLVFLPGQVLTWAGVRAPADIGAAQAFGLVAVVLGLALALWCVLAFGVVGKGTPAPFDPPRRLVVRGPYRFVRNPMYIGAIVGLTGASIFYESLALLGFTAVFALTVHLFVMFYEEPTLRRLFGEDYIEYCRRVRRWLPSTPP